MKRSFARYAALFALIAAAGPVACSTAFVDAESETPQADFFPHFSNMPPLPENVPDDEAWEQAAAEMIQRRQTLNANAEQVFSDALPDPEALAERARRRADPPEPLPQRR